MLNRFPKHGSKTIADLIYKENPLLFKNAEQVRSVVRSHRGENGDENSNGNALYLIVMQWAEQRKYS